MNVILYKRVSTDDQADRGFSLQHQEKVLNDYCNLRGYNIIDTYTEDYSGKTFDRPEWKKLMAYIKKHKKSVDQVLCLRWDRFSRNQYDALTTIKELEKLGVGVGTVEQHIDFSNPDNKVLLSLYLTLPEIENDKNSIRTTEGMRRAQIEGCWTGSAPRGYSNYRDGDKSTLKPNKDAPIIIEAFEKMASGGFAADEIRRWINQQGMKMHKQTFLDLIRNPAYMGKIYVKEWKKEPSQLSQGLHAPLISEEIYYRANEVLNGRKRKMKFHDDKSDLYPFKGFLACPVHNKPLTAYGALSRNKSIHHYYVCPVNQCKSRHRISTAHKCVEDILEMIQLSAQSLNLYRKILEKIFDREDFQRKVEIEKLQKEVAKFKSRKSTLQERFLDNDITPQDYNDLKAGVERDIVIAESNLNTVLKVGSTYKNYITKQVPMLENLVQFFRKADGRTKKKILGCIFDEKLVIENGRVATTPFSKPVSILLMIIKELEGSKNKKEVENDLLSTMAPPLRLERRTPSLTVMCSNQLS